DRALRRLLRRGIRGTVPGLDAIRRRLAEARRREQERLNLDGPLQEVRRRLEEILELERTALSFRAEDDARMREQLLELLPPDPAGRIRELAEYRFVDKEAQRQFDELVEWLRQEVLGSHFRAMAQ